MFHNVAMIPLRQDRISTAVTKCMRKSIERTERFQSMVTSVLDHRETVQLVGVCDRGCLLPSGKYKRVSKR